MTTICGNQRCSCCLYLSTSVPDTSLSLIAARSSGSPSDASRGETCAAESVQIGLDPSVPLRMPWASEAKALEFQIPKKLRFIPCPKPCILNSGPSHRCGSFGRAVAELRVREMLTFRAGCAACIQTHICCLHGIHECACMCCLYACNHACIRTCIHKHMHTYRQTSNDTTAECSMAERIMT